MYKELVAMCRASKNLYNAVLYIYRQAFTGKTENISEYADLVRDGKLISAYDLNTRLVKLNHPAFRALRNNVAQQVVIQVERDMKAFLMAVDKKKAIGQSAPPSKLPNYKPTGGLNRLTYTYVAARLRDGKIYIARNKALPLETRISTFREVRIVPMAGYLKVELVYDKPDEQRVLRKGRGAIGIELGEGERNLMTITADDGNVCAVIEGGPLRGIEEYYRRAVADLEAKYAKMGVKTSHRLDDLARKREFKIRDYLHKASRRVVELMVAHDIGTCYIGHSAERQREVNSEGSMTNRRYVHTLLDSLVSMIRYKVEEEGGEVIVLHGSTMGCTM